MPVTPGAGATTSALWCRWKLSDVTATRTAVSATRLCSGCSTRTREISSASYPISDRAGYDFPAEHIASLRWVPGVAWSDHLSFWRLGYPALMVTDTAFYRYPYYHSANDTPEKLAYPQLAQLTEGLFRALSTVSERGFG